MVRGAQLVLVLAVVSALAAGCPRRGAGRHDTASDPRAPELLVSDVRFQVPLDPDGSESATLGGALYRLDDDVPKRPAVLFVPGGGNASRSGSQRGDGAVSYQAAVDVTALWARAFAERGYLALAYDKRTCRPRDDVRCQANPTRDLDEEGPVALAKDLNAACALLAAEPDFDGRLVLFAHGQAAAVALASSCSERASVLVLVAPIPRRVDRVMVESLVHRERELRRAAKKQAGTPAAEELLAQANHLKNAAGSRAATFESMRKGQFAGDARVQGATIAFWQGWLALTEKAAESLSKARAPRVVVVGEADVQYAPADRERILASGELEGVTALQIGGADHHLLVNERLEDTTVQAVAAAVEKALAEGMAPAL